MRIERLAFGALLGTLAGLAQAQTSVPSARKLYYPACPSFQANMVFDCYRTYEEVTRFLQDAVRQHPERARLSSLGKSYQGRDLWLVTITDYSAGDPDGKPAVWVDGGIDADEVIATEAALGLIHRLLTSRDTATASLLRRRTFYIAPVVIPDISELHHTTPLRPRDTTARPWDDDNDGLLDEDGPDDLDGDGQALQMRRQDASGEWVLDERDSRLMRRRRPGDTGPSYRLYSEGIDDDGDGRYNEDPIGGVDPNRNYPGNWSPRQNGSGPFAGSEAELRAMLDFIAAHPNIAASQHFHSSGGVILRPPSVPDFNLPEEDTRLFMDVALRGLEVTAYNLATSVYDWNWPRGSRNTKRGQIWRDRQGRIQGWPEDNSGGGAAYPAYGGSIDAMYELFGVLAFANEIYQMGEDLDGDGSVSAWEQLRYNDSVMNGAAFKKWTPFQHPQLGAVEIGGWRKFGHNNPVGERMNEEVHRNVDFVLLQASLLPELAIADLRAEPLGGGIYRISATVRNQGYQPTELAIRVAQRRAVPVRAELSVSGSVDILSAKGRQELGVIAGYSEEKVEWLVRAPGGGAVTVRAWHPKAGKASREARLR
jgi:hypothetical protein